MSYEEQRLANIQRNLRELEEIGISTDQKALKKLNEKRKAKVASLGVRASKRPRRKAKAPPKPVRRSLRQQGKDADGKALPPDFNINRPSTYEPTAPAEREPVIEGNVEVSEDGKAFLESLKGQLGGADDEEPVVPVAEVDYAGKLAALSIDEQHGERKVTKERIYSLDISPVSDKVIVAAGDKFGHFGLWAVGSNLGEDGVLAQRPHSGTLACVQFDRNDPTRLFTASYDGRMMLFDMNKAVFTEVFSNKGESALYDIAFEGGSAFLANEDGDIVHFDAKAGKVVKEWSLHEKKINTIKFRPGNSHCFATASLDRSSAVWDKRKMKKPLHVLPHDLSVSQASWSPDGQRLCTVCMDNTLNVFDGETLCSKAAKVGAEPVEPLKVIKHDNRTGRWLTKFKVNWDEKHPSSFVVGSMDKPRCIEVFSSKSYKRLMRLRDDQVGSVQSLCVFHKSRNLIASCNASGRYHIDIYVCAYASGLSKLER